MLPAHLLAALGAAASDPRTQMLANGSRPLVAPPQTPLDLFQQAQSLPDAPDRRPALRTADLLGLGLALLAGPQGGQVLANYAQGKAQKAGMDTQRDQAAVERQRQLLTMQGQDLQRRQGMEAEARQSDLDRQSRERIAGIGAQTRENVAQIGADARLKAAEYAYKGKTLDAETKKRLAGLVSQDRQLSSALTLLPKLGPEARSRFLDGLRGRFDVLADLDDDAIEAVGEATAAEQAKLAQAQTFRAQTGYYGARTRNLDALTEPQRQALLARANKANQDAQTEMARAGLLEAQAGLVGKRVANYEPEMRARMARHLSAVGKAQGTNDARSVAQQRQAWGGILRLANEQIKRIKAETGAQGPMGLALRPDDLLAYQQAVRDQEEATEALKSLNRSVVSPVTQGRPRPNPAATGQGEPARFSMPPVMQGSIGDLPPAAPLVPPVPAGLQAAPRPKAGIPEHVTIAGKRVKSETVLLNAWDAIKSAKTKAERDRIYARLKQYGLRK